MQCSDDQRQGTAWVGGAARSKGRDNVEILSMSPRQSDCSTFTTRRPNETSSRRMTPSHNVLIDTVLTLGVVRRVGGAARSKGRHGVEILSMSPRQSDCTTFTTRRPNETSRERMTPSHNVLIDTVLTLGVVRRVGGAARSKGREGVEIL